MQTDEIKFLPGKATNVKQIISLYKEMKGNNKLINFRTGLPNNEKILWVLLYLMKRFVRPQNSAKKNHLLLVLIKLKLGLLHTDFAFVLV